MLSPCPLEYAKEPSKLLTHTQNTKYDPSISQM
jgi:hypothetical protein